MFRIASNVASNRLLANARKIVSGPEARRTFLIGRRGDPEVLQSSLPSLKSSLLFPILGATTLACGVGQYYYGYENNFYDYRFICDKDPDDLADFYGSESFMDIYCVMPFMGTLMMRGGYFDEDGTVHTTGLPGEMLVSMVFSDSNEEDDEEDEDDGQSINGDSNNKSNGPPSLLRTGQWFNKRERFKDVFMGYTMWDMVTNFGFETLPDGRTMVYHHGEYFKGNIPPISLLVRLIFGIHARWVAWATEHHLNHYAFQNSTEFDEKMEHDSRVDMPLFLLKNYAWSDLMAALFGRKVEKPSFLLKKSAEEKAKLKSEEKEEDEKDEEIEIVRLPEIEDAVVLSKDHELPFQKPAIMRRITLDINMDRRNSNIALGGGDDDEIQEDDENKLLPRQLSKKAGKPIQRISTNVALRRYETTLTRIKTGLQGVEVLQRQDTLGRENLGGNAAWEALRSTNNPEAYKAASMAARSNFSQRRATSTLRSQNSTGREQSSSASKSEK